MHLIITHKSPDLDASTACWLITRYLPGWNEAEYGFVPAGESWEGKDPDIDPQIIHVDTGLGKFDHHNTDAYISASLLVFKYLKKNGHIPDRDLIALERMIDYVNASDHFFEVSFPEADNDRYEFNFSVYIETVRANFQDDHKILEFMFPNLDLILQDFKNKVRAEKDISEGFVFQSKFGKCLAVESANEVVVKLAQKKGFIAVIRKHPIKGYFSIKTLPSPKYNLTPLYEWLVKMDKKANWYLHPSKNMLLNGSSKKPDMVASQLPINKVVEIMRKME
ncbi:hypothetical protein HGB07_05385 [Candidatus Roizmanbacteria bacterium]|nr:hypothetical protein [Candidatus Roizmanbacteria bacterium]